MDERLLHRVQAAGAILIGIAYFLPWASIISPFGTIQLRGIYVDYAWTLLLFTIIYLIAHFAEPNGETLGLPDSSIPYLRFVLRFAPFAFIALFGWYGASFAFNAHSASHVDTATLFGTEVASIVHAGLDYGFWIGVSGCILLILAVGLLLKKAPTYTALGLAITTASVLVAFGFNRPIKQMDTVSDRLGASASTTTTKPTASGALVQETQQPEFDASPYVQVSDITGVRLGKDYEASRFQDEVRIHVVFKNMSHRTIVGLKGRIAVLDGFGKEVYAFTFRDDDKIASGRESRGGGGYSFEDNPFINDEPYDQIVNLVTGGTARYSVKIRQIAFEDGSAMPEAVSK